MATPPALSLSLTRCERTSQRTINKTRAVCVPQPSCSDIITIVLHWNKHKVRRKSILLLDLGKDASGNDRHKIYHWANCQPAKLAPDTKNAVAKQRGRPKGATANKPTKTITKPPDEAGPKTPTKTGKEPPADRPADDQSEEEDEQPNPTTTKYGRKSKPPQRFGCGK